MKWSPKKDWLLNVALPLILGEAVYAAAGHVHLPAGVSNHLPDGLWAYSLLSAILLIWQRRVVTGWVVAVFFLSVLFEAAQYWHYLPGTGDILDIVTYFIFFGLALVLNPIYEKLQQTSSFPWRAPRVRSFGGFFKS